MQGERRVSLTDDGELVTPLEVSPSQNLLSLGSKLQDSEQRTQQNMLEFMSLHERASKNLENYCITIGKGNEKCVIFRNPLITFNEGVNIAAKYLVVNKRNLYILELDSVYIPKGKIKNKSLQGDLEESVPPRRVPTMKLLQSESCLISFHNLLRNIARNKVIPSNIKISYEDELPILNFPGERLDAFRNYFRAKCRKIYSPQEADVILTDNENYYKERIVEQEKQSEIINRLTTSHSLYLKSANEKPKKKRELNIIRRLTGR